MMLSQFACLCQFVQVMLDSDIWAFVVVLRDCSLESMSDLAIGCVTDADLVLGLFSAEDIAWRAGQCGVYDQFPCRDGTNGMIVLD